MNLRVHVDNVSGVTAGIPSRQRLRRWVSVALTGECEQAVIAIRIVDEQESQLLNGQWRGKQKPTNVLSFPMALPEGLGDGFLGDLVVCAPVVMREAIEQEKPLEAHWAHMIIHGVLHLLGYDHEADEDAEQMESREIFLLASLGFSDPYAVLPVTS